MSSNRFYDHYRRTGSSWAETRDAEGGKAKSHKRRKRGGSMNDRFQQLGERLACSLGLHAEPVPDRPVRPGGLVAMVCPRPRCGALLTWETQPPLVRAPHL